MMVLEWMRSVNKDAESRFRSCCSFRGGDNGSGGISGVDDVDVDVDVDDDAGSHYLSHLISA
jgi:hypothetical protein